MVSFKPETHHKHIIAYVIHQKYGFMIQTQDNDYWLFVS